MPRQVRKISSTGMYHIMIRGINKEPIYLGNRDNQRFLEILKSNKERNEFELYAYCLMKNHAHFLMKEHHISISVIMKEICGKYGNWFNHVHERTGHVFQDRFRSECVETDLYFQTVFRYILNNPVKGKLVEKPEDYPWSSCNEYLSGKGRLTDTHVVLSMLDERKDEALWKLKRALHRDDTIQDIVYLNVDRKRRSDQDALQIIEQMLKQWHIPDPLHLNHMERELVIGHLLAQGLTKRQCRGIGDGNL